MKKKRTKARSLLLKARILLGLFLSYKRNTLLQRYRSFYTLCL